MQILRVEGASGSWGSLRAAKLRKKVGNRVLKLGGAPDSTIKPQSLRS